MTRSDSNCGWRYLCVFITNKSVACSRIHLMFPGLISQFAIFRLGWACVYGHSFFQRFNLLQRNLCHNKVYKSEKLQSMHTERFVQTFLCSFFLLINICRRPPISSWKFRFWFTKINRCGINETRRLETTAYMSGKETDSVFIRGKFRGNVCSSSDAKFTVNICFRKMRLPSIIDEERSRKLFQRAAVVYSKIT